MAVSEDREKIIRAAWAERGKAQWDPKTHGRGLLSLHIPAKVEMHPVRVGAPLPPYDDLEFRLVRATMGGQPTNSIVCETVLVEAIEDVAPSAGWMSASDDATSQIVQMVAENQRRNIAAISSQPTFVAQPMAAATRIGVQGKATPTVKFADSEAVAEWLSRQSDDVAVAFAARAALRVVPAITFSSWVSGSKSIARREIVLRAFGAVAAAWAVAAYPAYRDLLNNGARKALFGLGDVRSPPPIRAAAYAAATATGEADVFSRASRVISYALDAAAAKGRLAFEALLAAFAVDAGLLDAGCSPVTLATAKLWPGPTPDWIRDGWAEIRAELLSLNEDWDVWTEWYDARLAGNYPNQDVQIARVTIEDTIWKESPGVLNAHIKELTAEREIFQYAAEDEPDELPNADAIPRQTTAASQFVLDAEGRLDLLRDMPISGGMQNEVYQEVRYKALTLAGLGHNQLAGMTEPITRFLIAAPERIESASITRLWSRGNTLRLRLKANDLAVSSADPTDPAVLTAAVAEMLRDLVDTYNIFIVGDPAGRELDQIRLGPQDRDHAVSIVDLAAPIAEAVKISQDLATATATEVLTEQIEAARNAPAGVDGDQMIDLSRKTTSNFVIELLRSAYALIRAEPSFALKEYRAGVYRALGGITAAGVVSLPIISFVANNAEVLKVFVERTFQNPTLVQIIEAISKINIVH
jgi:hypothetical protein